MSVIAEGGGSARWWHDSQRIWSSGFQPFLSPHSFPPRFSTLNKLKLFVIEGCSWPVGPSFLVAVEPVGPPASAGSEEQSDEAVVRATPEAPEEVAAARIAVPCPSRSDSQI